MAAEHQPTTARLKSVHLDLHERSLTFTADDETATRLTLTPEGVLYELLDRSPITGRSVEKVLSPAETREKQPVVTIAGRLKTQPKEGRPDGRGNPTSWAVFAAHEEGSDEPHMYSATFHRHTAKLALSLSQDAQVTAQGYVRPSTEPEGKRMDGFSIFNLVNYPGKPHKQDPQP